jgi:hypothetical protein
VDGKQNWSSSDGNYSELQRRTFKQLIKLIVDRLM